MNPTTPYPPTPDGRAFINGQRCWAQAGARFDNISPVHGQVLCEVARADAADIDLAVQAARRAFADKRWSGLAPAVRKRVLIKWADLILAHAPELALLETLDMGKPIQYATQVDVNSTANCIRWYGEAIDKVYDEIAPTPAKALALITREPMGVVGAIVPWNYPMIMAAWKIAPALACGNSVVLKPSEKSPLTALRLAELAMEAGLPAGVLNVVPGFGTEAGTPLAMHMDADLERAVQTAVGSIFFNQGESCNAPSRLLLHRHIKDAFVERALQLLPQYQPADPLQHDTVMGAIVDRTQLDTVLGYIAKGRQEGAALLAGGEVARVDSGGFYVQPAIFDGVNPHMTIAREEIFGPVLSVMAFNDVQEAVQLANDHVYGLQASIWTRDINCAHGVARALRAGTVHVNQYDEDDITVPFGGYKQSGVGRDKSLHAFDKYTELKTTWIRIDSPV